MNPGGKTRLIEWNESSGHRSSWLRRHECNLSENICAISFVPHLERVDWASKFFWSTRLCVRPTRESVTLTHTESCSVQTQCRFLLFTFTGWLLFQALTENDLKPQQQWLQQISNLSRGPRSGSLSVLVFHHPKSEFSLDWNFHHKPCCLLKLYWLAFLYNTVSIDWARAHDRAHIRCIGSWASD